MKLSRVSLRTALQQQMEMIPLMDGKLECEKEQKKLFMIVYFVLGKSWMNKVNFGSMKKGFYSKKTGAKTFVIIVYQYNPFW